MEEDELASMFRDEPEDNQSMQNNAGSAGGSAPRTDETAGGTRGKTCKSARSQPPIFCFPGAIGNSAG